MYLVYHWHVIIKKGTEQTQALVVHLAQKKIVGDIA